MKRNNPLAVALLLAATVNPAWAEPNVGTCGWGSKMMDGNSGVAAQVMAVTTNTSFSNQTFAITSGTSGCTRDGTVTSEWEIGMFIDGNREALARDSAVGAGEALDALAALIGVADEDRSGFARLSRENFSRIFSAADVGADQVQRNLRQVVAADPVLSKYADAI